MSLVKDPSYSFIADIWGRFKKNKIALAALIFLIIISLIGIYAPFFAASKPLFLRYDEKYFFPLFRYLFFPGYYTKPIDIFFNVLMFTLPAFLLGIFLSKKIYNKKFHKIVTLIFLISQLSLSFFLMGGVVKDPQTNLSYIQAKEARALPNFDRDLGVLNDYQKLNMIIKFQQQKEQKERLLPLLENVGTSSLLYDVYQRREQEERQRLTETLAKSEEKYNKALEEWPSYVKAYLPTAHELSIQQRALKESGGHDNALQKSYEQAIRHEKESKQVMDDAEELIYNYRYAKAKLLNMDRKSQWLKSEKIDYVLAPLIRNFHWEEDAGGSQLSNQHLPWWERTRLNRKDLTAGLIYGIRVTLIVGFCAVSIALVIGLPLGLVAGYFAGKVDMITLRFIEIWEAMPTFFTLLLISAIFHSKSLFLTIIVLGLFSWTGFARFVRAESLRERGLTYVMASRSLGLGHIRIMFSDILPNAISPILAVLPFSMMAAITSEAALSFLGLGEENSTSWGVLMSEARTVFPGESYLLWPPALFLTTFLVAIALIGDGIRDALDPKTNS